MNEPDTSAEAVKGQSFSCQQHWINTATSRLTRHPQYHNTEQDGPAKGWRGPHFTTMCFDQKGRRVRNGGDFQRAEDEGAFPVWWIWPDQIAPLVTERDALKARVDELEGARELKPLPRHDGQENGWTLPPNLLLEIEQEVRNAGWDTCMEVTEIVALSIERRILSALKGDAS